MTIKERKAPQGKKVVAHQQKSPQTRRPGSAGGRAERIVEFPLDVLPAQARDYAVEAGKTLKTDPDYLAVSMIFAAAAAVGNNYWLKVKNDVMQKTAQYLALVGEADSGKIDALKTALRPLLRKHADEFENYQAQAEAYMKKQKISATTKTQPVFNRLMIQSAGRKTIIRALTENPRGITLYRDDLSRLLLDMKRLHRRGEQEFWRSAWSGNFLFLDDLINEPLMVDNPFFSIVGTIPPEFPAKLARGYWAGQGFMHRFLFCWPDKKEPSQDEPEISKKPTMDFSLQEAYDKAIGRLLQLSPRRDGQACRLVLTPKARRRLFHFFNQEINPLCNRTKDELLTGMYGKIDLYCLRLTLALHLLHWAYGDQTKPHCQIGTHTADLAIKAARYFRGQALKLRRKMKNEE